jgi:hypothetical protein
MSIVFIECASFREMLPFDHVCCPKCHEFTERSDGSKLYPNLIYVRPTREDNANPDWSLCIEGLVCCKAYHIVKDLPRSWWVREAKERGVYREDQRGYIYSNTKENDTDKPKPSASAKRARRIVVEDDEPESFASFINKR